jgi:hypothetical protein
MFGQTNGTAARDWNTGSRSGYLTSQSFPVVVIGAEHNIEMHICVLLFMREKVYRHTLGRVRGENDS